eukprot:Pgem_evm1s8303
MQFINRNITLLLTFSLGVFFLNVQAISMCDSDTEYSCLYGATNVQEYCCDKETTTCCRDPLTRCCEPKRESTFPETDPVEEECLVYKTSCAVGSNDNCCAALECRANRRGIYKCRPL